MIDPRIRKLFPLLLLVALLGPAEPASGAGEGRWRGPDGEFLPFKTDQEVLVFLRTARVASKKVLTSGINRPWKVRLESGGVAANAIFRTIDRKQHNVKIGGRLVRDFHDSHIYECAAYGLSRLLGIDNVPPCVRRRLESQDGTLQLWVEEAMTEKQRRETGKKPKGSLVWPRQRQTMVLFDLLINNIDRNQGNILIDGEWKLWFIDHTRSFGLARQIENPARIVWCRREVWEKLQALDKKQLRKIGSLVGAQRLIALLKRRDRLVGYLGTRIAERGEDTVLFETVWSDGPDADVSEDDLAVASSEDIPSGSVPLFRE